MTRDCVQNDFQDVAVRALSKFKADRDFRVSFGRAMDVMTVGVDVQQAFQHHLPMVDEEIRNQTGIENDVNFYRDRLRTQSYNKGRFQMLR